MYEGPGCRVRQGWSWPVREVESPVRLAAWPTNIRPALNWAAKQVSRSGYRNTVGPPCRPVSGSSSPTCHHTHSSSNTQFESEKLPEPVY